MGLVLFSQVLPIKNLTACLCQKLPRKPQTIDLLHGRFYHLFFIKMAYYYNLCDSKTFDSIRDALTLYGVSEDVLNFTFGIHGRNEETLEDICYYYGLDIDEILKEAGIEPEEEESKED